MRTMLEANQEREVIEKDVAHDKVAVCSLTRNESPNAFKQPRTCNICLLI